jgi:hypothetical protein
MRSPRIHDGLCHPVRPCPLPLTVTPPAAGLFRLTEGWSTDRARKGRSRRGESRVGVLKSDLGETVPGWGSVCDCVECSGAYIAGGG